MSVDEWALWKRALLLNAAGVTGAAISLATAEPRVMQYGAGATVFALAFINFVFFVVRPRLATARKTTEDVTALDMLFKVVREQPLIFALVLLLLIGASKAEATAVVYAQTSNSTYVRGLPNATTIAHRAIAMSVAMGCIGLLWAIGAVGLWARRNWAWWLSLVLNGLAAGLTILLQLFTWHSYVLDVFATAAVVLLVLPSVRHSFSST